MGLFKRNKIWWMRFNYHGKQERRSTGTSNKALAEAILGKLKAKIIEGRFFDTLEEKERTFIEMMERYLEERVVKRTDGGPCRSYIKTIISFFGQRVLADITPGLIVQYKTKRSADGISPSTINNELKVMKHAFGIAIKEWEWCRENPVSRVSMEKESRGRDRWLTDEEEASLLETSPPWVREIVIFALNTGMRRGEILSLTWEGVDFFRSVVTLFHSKNGELRTIPINQTVQDLLREKMRVRALKNNLVFNNQTYMGIKGSDLNYAFRSVIRRAKIVDFHFHDLRHTFATRLVQAGVDLYKVSRLLGHRSITMTQRYAHHYPESLRDGVKLLDQRGKSTKIAQQAIHAAGGSGISI